MAWVKGPTVAETAADLMVSVNETLLAVMAEQGETVTGLSKFMYGHPGASRQMPGPGRSFNYTLESLARVALALGKRVNVVLVDAR